MAYYSPPVTQSNETQSRYNEAEQQIHRLHNLWNQCHSAYLAGKFDHWNHILSRIYVELYADAIRQSKSDYVEKWEKLNKEIIDGKLDCEKEIDYKEDRIIVEKQKRRAMTRFKLIFNSVCHKKELFLKDWQTKVGKGSSYREDSSRMF